MKNINTKKMDENSFLELKDVLTKEIEQILCVPVSLEFKKPFCHNPGIINVIVINHVDNSERNNIFFDFSDKIIETYNEKYGEFELDLILKEPDDVKDVDIGDMVLISGFVPDENYKYKRESCLCENRLEVGIVTSIFLKNNQEKVFAVSIVSVVFSDDKYAFAKEAVSTSFYFREESYSGFYSGFKKKLTKEEFSRCLKHEIEFNSNQIIDRINESKEYLINGLSEFVKKCSDKKIFEPINVKISRINQNNINSLISTSNSLENIFRKFKD